MAKKQAKPSPVLVIMILAAALVLSMVANIILATVAGREKQAVIAVDDSLRIMRPAPLDQVNISDAKVLDFAEEALRASFSHDFSNHIATLNYAKRFYTTQGGRMLQEQIEPLLEDIRKERAVMSARTDAPLMARSAHLYHGRVAWQVEIPITIRFQGQRSAYSPRERVALMLVVQVPPEEHARGMSVHTIQLLPPNKGRQ